MIKPTSTLVAAAALVAACVTSASADGWKFTVTESYVGQAGVCGPTPTWVPCTVTNDPHVPYAFATLTAAPGANLINFFQELSGTIDEDNHTLLSFVPDSNLPAQQFDITGPVPPGSLLSIDIEVNVIPPKGALTGTIDIAYQGRMFGFLSMHGYNNEWLGYWVTRQGGLVHQFKAVSERTP